MIYEQKLNLNHQTHYLVNWRSNRTKSFSLLHVSLSEKKKKVRQMLESLFGCVIEYIFGKIEFGTLGLPQIKIKLH